MGIHTLDGEIDPIAIPFEASIRTNSRIRVPLNTPS